MTKGPWTGKVIGAWRVGAFLGSGGNGAVYQVTDGAHEAAIKIANVSKTDRLERFLSEIEAMRRCGDIPGVLPLLASGCAKSRRGARLPWFVMGLATPIENALGADAKTTEVVAACLQIADTIAQVHSRGISHRDLKPKNLFWYSGRYAVGDFGLVDFPGKAELTAKGEKLGPIHYIAPEMLAKPEDADGAKADVYSFAKTIWVLITGQKYPIQGQLDRTNPAVALGAYVSEPRAGLLDRILEAATAFRPGERPTMAELADELRTWGLPADTSPLGPLDISDLAPDIAGINSRQAAEDMRVKSNQLRIEGDGFRIREAFRPLAEAIKSSMENAGFLNVRLSIDNYFWGFELAGHVLAMTGPGEAELHVTCSIQIPGEPGQIKAEFAYEANLNFGQGVQKRLIHSQSVSFWPGGSAEQVAIDSLISQMSGAFRPSVQEILRFSQNPTGVGQD